MERERADRAASVAQRHEEQFHAHEGSFGDLHRRLAGIHRRIELRHLAAAEIHEAYADRLARFRAGTERIATSTVFMSAVALTARSQGAVLTMCGAERVEALVAASGPIAREAQDIEFTLGEGPNHDVLATGRSVFATGPGLLANWPSYGGAATDLGVKTVAAVPLEGPGGMRLGSLAIFDPWLGESRLVVPVLRTVAEALTQSVLLAWEPTDTEAVPPVLEEADYHQEVFQATGLVMVQCRCDFDSALALLRARAFSTNRPIGEVSTEVVAGRLRLDPP